MVLQSFTPELARSAGLADNRFPNSEEEADLAEQVLTRELEKLSLDEHERLLFDIHGICRSTDEENEKYITEKLGQLEACLNKMKRKKKEAYDRARFLNKKYVDSRAFRLAFLRSDRFNAKAAAQTIINHFDIKRRIFGDDEVLGRDVLQTDLNEEDLVRLNDGYIQVLPERDAAGRTVICLNLSFKRQDSLASPLVGDASFPLLWHLRDPTLKLRYLTCLLWEVPSILVLPNERHERCGGPEEWSRVRHVQLL
jgi:hypothetical protein